MILKSLQTLQVQQWVWPRLWISASWRPLVLDCSGLKRLLAELLAIWWPTPSWVVSGGRVSSRLVVREERAVRGAIHY